ncbi:MAG: hypothetical protein LGB54_01365 [Sulfurovum sp.]|nr:hypothetical protein [Sulfurovum sp.]MCB4759506.1 hypothetical protein [Sulfurovum sp.]
MKDSQKSPPDLIDETEVLDEKPNPSRESKITATFHQQNNYHLSQTIDLDQLSILSRNSPEIASRVMDLYEKQQQHNIECDEKIIALEEKEQKARLTEVPYQRKFAFRALRFAKLLALGGLISAAYFAFLRYPILGGVAITIPIGIGVANILGFKSTIGNTKQDKEQ